ncbi:hypothetical protein Mgra_00007618 [Meloidogyne graminicola]|uniref:Uncharacterized protein n=1 Tax=Meloidogyne graminicola TaxID=189291 RepID=A0A8S9ZHX5_9BILA|nr:hypothetical protein Mgra_00007618 [Meloidogyne graminicola]
MFLCFSGKMDRFLRHLNSQICHLSSKMFYIFSLFIITNFAFCLDQDWDLNFACREDLKRLSRKLLDISIKIE